MQSIGQFFEGDPLIAVEALNAAARFTQGGANPRRHALISAQLARAYAANGDASAATRCLEQAAPSLEQATAPPSGLDFFDQARLSGIAGTCNLLMGRPEAAAGIISEALAQRSVADLKGRALLTLDLASCLLNAGEVEEACRIAESALDLASHSIVQPITIRARSLKAELQPWRELGSVQGFTERVRANQPVTMLEG
ncbi:hypothetical protein GCM10009839_60410 [Catenulispora yoronensis]|uniref:MalT-like TPR region domain-containing protein n=1 Tax=Catenulispora yoronensis TaxID=450799 RepID=A0ABP5GJS2_9ACTN